MALLLFNVFYFITFLSIYCVKSETCQPQDNCPDEQRFQSPINIIQCDTTKAEFPALQLENLNSTADVTITNNGYTLKSTQAQSASITGGPLSNTYDFVELHFHWGSTDNVGSEHQIDGEAFSMEGHFVFSRSYEINTSIAKLEKMRKLYYYNKCLEVNPSYGNCIDTNDCTNEIPSTTSCDVEAETERRTEQIAARNAGNQFISWIEKQEPNGNPCDKFETNNPYSEEAVQFSTQTVTVNVVLGALFVASENGVTYDLLEKAREVVNVNSTVEVSGDYISQFVYSINLDSYFTYSGSLTTPPHSTNVIWIVFQDPLSVSSDQLVLLRNLNSDEGGHITENFREIQPLYDRVVCYRQGGADSPSC